MDSGGHDEEIPGAAGDRKASGNSWAAGRRQSSSSSKAAANFCYGAPPCPFRPTEGQAPFVRQQQGAMQGPPPFPSGLDCGAPFSEARPPGSEAADQQLYEGPPKTVAPFGAPEPAEQLAAPVPPELSTLHTPPGILFGLRDTSFGLDVYRKFAEPESEHDLRLVNALKTGFALASRSMLSRGQSDGSRLGSIGGKQTIKYGQLNTTTAPISANQRPETEEPAVVAMPAQPLQPLSQLGQASKEMADRATAAAARQALQAPGAPFQLPIRRNHWPSH